MEHPILLKSNIENAMDELSTIDDQRQYDP